MSTMTHRAATAAQAFHGARTITSAARKSKLAPLDEKRDVLSKP